MIFNYVFHFYKYKTYFLIIFFIFSNEKHVFLWVQIIISCSHVRHEMLLTYSKKKMVSHGL